MEGMILVKDGNIASGCNDLFRGFLTSGKLDALLVSRETPNGKMAFPALISDPDKLGSNILSPILSVSEASEISRMTINKGSDRPIGVVIRPCQVRALTEIVKLNQANLENIVVISMDCPGTMDINTFSNLPEGTSPTGIVMDHLLKGTDIDQYLRSSCRTCKDPVPVNADITIGLFGVDLGKGFLVQAHTESGERLLEGIKLEGYKGKREEAIAKVRGEKDAKREAFISSNKEIKGIEAIADFYDKCVNCHNCMNACPICYCKECIFDSSVFDSDANKYVHRAKNKGIMKMPDGALLFHITRMNHMILSCVECGLCEQACPSNIPLMDLLIPVAENAQKELDYYPGKDPDEKLPMVVFREDEYRSVGEK